MSTILVHMEDEFVNVSNNIHFIHTTCQLYWVHMEDGFVNVSNNIHFIHTTCQLYWVHMEDGFVNVSNNIHFVHTTMSGLVQCLASPEQAQTASQLLVSQLQGEVIYLKRRLDQSPEGPFCRSCPTNLREGAG